MARIRKVNTRNIATYGLGDITQASGYKVAFPEINFYEIFTDQISVNIIQPDEIEFLDQVGSLEISSISVKQEIPSGGGGEGFSQRRKRRNEQVEEDDRRILRVTRVRAYSIFSEEIVNGVTLTNRIYPRSIVNENRFGNTSVSIGVNDEEEIIMMLLSL